MWSDEGFKREMENSSAVRPGKLNSRFIVTARMDFQIFSKNFRFQIVYSNYMALWPAPSSVAIEGRGLDDREFEPSVSRTLLLV